MPHPKVRSLPLLLVVAVGSVFAGFDCHAQIGAIDPSFNAGSGANGVVGAVAALDDGKVLIAGDFTAVNGVARSRVARLNADGSLDTTFDPGAGPNALVRSFMVQEDGKVVIGGDFTSVGGVARGRLARLTTTGALDTSFLESPMVGANASVHAVVNFKGRILIGGEFTTFNNNHATQYAAFIETNGSDSAPFGLNGSVYSIAPIPNDSRVYLGGAFTAVNNGVSRARLARFNDGGGVDSGFNPGAGLNGTVTALAIENPGPGAVYAGGNFTSANGQSRAGLARFESTGAVSTIFNPGTGPAGTVGALLRLSNGQLAVGGAFTSFNGAAASNIAAVNGSTGALIPSTASLDGPVHGLAGETDGKLFIAGDSTAGKNPAWNRIARLYGPGGSAPPAAPGWTNVAQATPTQLILTWGGVSYLTGYKIERSPGGSPDWTEIAAPSGTAPYVDNGLAPGTTYLYRVRAYSTNGEGAYSPVAGTTTFATSWALAGSRDASFGAAIGSGANSGIYASAVQSDGKVLLGGSFSAINGTARPYLARLGTDGVLDATFSAAPDSIVEAIATQPDGKILIGGYFSKIGNVAQTRIARLNADGSLDATFAPPSGANSIVRSLAVQPDGRIVLAGSFTTVNGVSRNGIARLDSDGTLDTSFDPGSGLSFSNGYIIVLQPDGRVIVGGFFQSANGVARGNIARFNVDGSLDGAFATGGGANSWVESLRLQPDGRILIVGAFVRYDGITRNGVARLLSDGSIDTAFDPGTGVEHGWPRAIAVQIDGKVIIGGWFTMVGGFGSFRVARLNADGSRDTTFQPGLGFNSDVRTLTMQTDGKCIAGGWFSTINEVASNFVARLQADNGSAPPASPVTLGATPTSSTELALLWPAADFASGFQIEQSADGETGWTTAATLGSGSISHAVTGLTPSTTYHFRVRAFSTNGPAIASSPVASATTYTPYQQWRLDAELVLDAPASADSNGNGIPDFVEYALGFSPIGLPMNELPAAVIQSPNLTFTYARARSEVTYLVECSTDLDEWTSDGVDQGVPDLTVTASVPIGTDTRKFLRLRVSIP